MNKSDVYLHMDTRLRKAFRDYVTAPYANNQTSLRSMRTWCGELFSSSVARTLTLDYVRATKADGTRLDGFRLNKQIMFSHHGAVLTMPHPSRLGNVLIREDQPYNYVGIWLNDFGSHRDLERATQEVMWANASKTSEEVRLNPEDFRAIQFVSSKIRQEMRKYIPAKYLGRGEVRFAHSHSGFKDCHSDFTDPKQNQISGWNYTVLYGFRRTATRYALNPEVPDVEQDHVVVPTFTTYSHLAIRFHENPLFYGASHAATLCDDWRGIFLFSDQERQRQFIPFDRSPSPWLIETMKSPGGPTRPRLTIAKAISRGLKAGINHLRS